MTFVTPVNSIHSGLKLFNKEQIFHFISEKTSEQTGFEAPKILTKLFEAENRHPSGIGEGVAIPHLKLCGIKAPYTLFAKLSQPVEFDAVDGQPVDMVFLLVSPEKDGPLHLSRLARISRLFRDRDLCRNLRKTNNNNLLRSLIQQQPAAINDAA